MKNINNLTLGEVAEIVAGELTGNPGLVIEAANTLENAGPAEITFLANPKYKSLLEETRAAAVIVSMDADPLRTSAYIRVADPAVAYRKILEALYPKKEIPFEGISPLASVDPKASLGSQVNIGDFVRIEKDAVIGDGVSIYPGSYIGCGVKIGAGSLLYPKVTIMDKVTLGERVVVNSSTVIGGEGFGFSTEDGRHLKVPQVGGVSIGNDVEIGSNVSIDRGSPGDTVIGDGTKIDNLVQIAHNVEIGRNCLIISQVGIAGSTIVEDYAVLAGQAGIVGHIRIGSGAMVGAQAGVTRNVPPGQLVSGYPAMEHSSARKLNVLIRKLPRLFRQVEEISKALKPSE
ncbi:MAG: UDP-3-O-(3-hydroxymyristoyl)glucosamine N-acyltransferase [Elusimicrobia bacterium]|nr:UDP-3-O-(3-hydroxymyristoyl)glucosamine N-acyltransferase [Elusimicrobiota bacterium]